MKIIAVLSVLLSIAASQAALLGAKECTYGPAYWCDNLKNAKQCGAVNHCIKSVWEKQVLPEDNDSICTICKDMVKQARDQLESKENQELMKQVFEGACQLIPIQEIQKECIKYSDEFIPEIIETLASQMNPQIVCATVGLCNSHRVDKLLAEQAAHEVVQKKFLSPFPKAANDCPDCKAFITDVKAIVEKASKQDVLNTLMEVCGRLGSISEGCMAVVQVNIDKIYSYLHTQFEPKAICDLIGFCPSHFLYGGKLAHLPKPKSGDEVCDFCEAIVQHWRDTLASNTTREEFKEVLNSLCNQMGGFGRECHSLVEQYYTIIYDLLISEVQPQQVCQAVGLCGPNSVFKNDFPVWTLFNIKPADHIANMKPSESDIVGRDESAAYNLEKSRQSNIEVVPLGKTGFIPRNILNKEEESDKCMICEFVLHFLQGLLQQKTTREEIKTALDNVCQYLPKTINEQCQDYVDAYGDQIIQMIILEMDPSTICPMIHMCPSPNKPNEKALLKSTSGEICTTCEFVMTVVEELLKKNTMSIENALKQVCNVFPHSITVECDSFVDKYGLLIIEYLENDVKPKDVCTYMGLCRPNEQINAVQIKKPKFEQSKYCIMCEFIIHEIDRFLEFPPTVAKIEEVLDKVCSILPASVGGECLMLIDAYKDVLIQELIEDFDPMTVCTKVKLCKDTYMKGFPVLSVNMPVDKCIVCEYVIDSIHKSGKNTNIESLVNNICSSLQTDAQYMCEQMVRDSAYGAHPLMKELGSSKAACQAMNMCPVNVEKRHLLGEKKCTWGPSYWCQSEWHAASCGATRHCVEKVWKNDKPSVS